MTFARNAAFALIGGSVAAAAIYLYSTSRSSSGKKKGLSGLYNLGNTCYANALIQGLSSLPSMVAWLRKMQCDGGDETRFVEQLRKLILELESVNGETLSAWGVSEALISHGWTVGIGVEQDLHELLNVFMTTWEEELTHARTRRLSASLLDVRQLHDETLGRMELALQSCSAAVRLHCESRAPCTGISATQLKCAVPECSFKKLRHDAFSVIPLSIPKNLQGMSVIGAQLQKLRVETLLRDYFRLEFIRGATCDACKLKSGKTDSGLLKHQGIAKLPPTLIIRVERVGVLPSGALYKVGDHVDFAETLDVRDFCFYRSKVEDYDKAASESRTPERTSRIVGGAARGGTARAARGGMAGGGLPFRNTSTIDGGSFVAENIAAARYRYQLRAVSEHRGLAETGHFVTYRRGLPATASNHAWYLTNDTQVTRVPYAQVAAAQAYMLYYERIRIPNSC